MSDKKTIRCQTEDGGILLGKTVCLAEIKGQRQLHYIL